jgi:hypothetical protein
LEFTGECSLSVLDRGKEGLEGKCASGAGRVEIGAKRSKRKRRRTNCKTIKEMEGERQERVKWK